ncbi:hypothetical protein DQ04_00431090 [Trypanosoma grayi]|uniref:hypothetical protein n=1 Tax=Trypanosoma grayi TaxID=71804 RepID=UPI0004F4A354|nr:hypothetical protein DQ04_00431090 [Trypanosoma grayi]KEG14505.1 hypothetical protein DQ04_00431090 [Trypanosoma grayi]
MQALPLAVTFTFGYSNGDMEGESFSLLQSQPLPLLRVTEVRVLGNMRVEPHSPLVWIYHHSGPRNMILHRAALVYVVQLSALPKHCAVTTSTSSLLPFQTHGVGDVSCGRMHSGLYDAPWNPWKDLASLSISGSNVGDQLRENGWSSFSRREWDIFHGRAVLFTSSVRVPR